MDSEKNFLGVSNCNGKFPQGNYVCTINQTGELAEQGKEGDGRCTACFSGPAPGQARRPTYGDSNTAARSLGHAGDENSIVKSCRRQGRAH